MADPAATAPLAGAGLRAAAPARGATVPVASLLPVWCVVLAALSIGLQGFQFGLNNNLFHIPIVLRWYDLPQFAQDPFIQSLRRYATPVFPALSLVATDGNIRHLFLACHLATRSLTFWALTELATALGLTALEAGAAAAAVALAAVVYGFSGVGKDELLVSIFTHTALAQACAILALAWMLQGRTVGAALAAAAAFDVNFMVGVWCLAPLGAVALARLRRDGLASLVRPAVAFALAAAPVAVWMLRAQPFRPLDFDYPAYLAAYYGNHFFIGWAPWSDRLTLLAAVAAGLGGAFALPCRRAEAALAVASLALLFLAGVVVGQASHSRLLLNLHLLRSDGLTLWLCASLVATTAAAALARGRPLQAVPALLAFAGLATGLWPLVAAGAWLLVLAGRRARPSMPTTPALLAAGLALMAGAGALAGRYSPGDRPADPAWSETTAWVRSHTAREALFLTPWSRDFVALAGRRDWVSWKEGASAMWAPETYAVWRRRSDEVRALKDADATLAFACAHGVGYVVLERTGPQRLAGAETAGPTLFANREFRVTQPACAAPPAPGAGA